MMADGEETGIEEIWDGVKTDDDPSGFKMAVKSSLIITAKHLKGLPCQTRKKEISNLKKFMWLLMGMGILMAVALVPMAIEMIPKLFDG